MQAWLNVVGLISFCASYLLVLLVSGSAVSANAKEVLPPLPPFPRYAATRTIERRSVDSVLQNLSQVPGGFTHDELRALLQYYMRANSILEWGMGTTTILASQMGVPRLTAIESDFLFASQVRKRGNLSSHYRIVHVDIGETGSWGRPLRKSAGRTRALWPFYSLGSITSEEPFDVYLIDGRFRVACACIALLHSRNTSSVLIHDFPQRERYQKILSVAIRSEVHGKLVVLRRNPDVDANVIKRLWDETKFDPS